MASVWCGGSLRSGTICANYMAGMVSSSPSVLSRISAKSKIALILLDPPVGETFYVGNGSRRKLCYMPNTPHRGGYVDFSKPVFPKSEVDTVVTGPGRVSALDDLCFYWSRPDLVGQFDFSSPVSGALLLKRYVAAHWMALGQYHHESLMKDEFRFKRRNKLVELSPSTLEQEWSDVQGLNA